MDVPPISGRGRGTRGRGRATGARGRGTGAWGRATGGRANRGDAYVRGQDSRNLHIQRGSATPQTSKSNKEETPKRGSKSTHPLKKDDKKFKKNEKVTNLSVPRSKIFVSRRKGLDIPQLQTRSNFAEVMRNINQDHSEPLLTDSARNEAENLLNIILEPKSTTEEQTNEEKVKKGMIASRRGKQLLSPYAPEFYPPDYEEPEVDSTLKKADREFNVQELTELMEQRLIEYCYESLIEKPGCFEEVMDVVSSYFQQCVRHPHILEIIAGQLLQYSLLDDTFGYHSLRIYSRLCDICQQLKVDCEPVTAAFLKAIEGYYIQVSIACSHDNRNIDEFIKVLRFLREVYIQVTSPPTSGFRLKPLGRAVLTMCNTLMGAEEIPMQQRFREVALTIKLTGQFLDEDVEPVMNLFLLVLWLKNKNEQSNISEGTYNMIEDLINLRYDRWKVPISATSIQRYQDECAPNEDGVFYGPDGTVINYEEQVFLDECPTDNVNYLQAQMESLHTDEDVAYDRPQMELHGMVEDTAYDRSQMEIQAMVEDIVNDSPQMEIQGMVEDIVNDSPQMDSQGMDEEMMMAYEEFLGSVPEGKFSKD